MVNTLVGSYYQSIAKVTLLASLLLVTLVCHASSPHVVTARVKAEDFPRATQVRALVATALAKVATMRANVSRGKQDHVADYLAQLTILFDLIEASRPAGEVDALANYYKEQLSFEDNQQALADVLPLYSAFSKLAHSQRTVLARQQLDRVRSALQNGQRANALAALEDMRRALAVDGVDFPLQAAEEKLQTIRDSFQGNQQLPSDAALFELETNLLEILNSLP